VGCKTWAVEKESGGLFLDVFFQNADYFGNGLGVSVATVI
jgi:hypothetical protein